MPLCLGSDYEMAAYNFASRANRNFQNPCCLCRKILGGGKIYVRSLTGKLAHFKCASEHGWKRLCAPKSHNVKREQADKSIKVVRNGRVIKRVD